MPDTASLDFVGGCYNHHPYEIELSRLNTPEKLSHWLHHLWCKVGLKA